MSQTGRPDKRVYRLTDEGRKANRRCELVVVPSLGEVLDLRDIAGSQR